MIIVGLKNGFVRVYPYAGTQVFQSLEEYWTRGSHDSQDGPVTHLTAAYDDRCVLSGGVDGNIFGYVVNGHTIKDEKITNTPTMPVSTVNHVY
jgi:hypothetical protein